MLLPDGDDPDSFARKHNATEFQEYIAAHEVDFIRFKTNLLMADAGNDPYKRAALITDIVKSIAVIPEAIVRSEYIKECSQMLHIEERILVSEVAKLKKEKEEAQAKSAQRQNSAATSAEAGTAPTSEEGAAEPGSTSPIGTVPATEDEGYYEALAAGYESAPAGNVNNDVANSQSPHPSSLTPHHSSLNPLYSQERLIVQQLIRHGEKTVFVDEESGRDISVTEYVAAELEMDEITLSTPLFAEVLKELQQHIGEPGFTAERHFINHANPALSRLAVDLIEEKYQLSKYHSKTQTIVSDAERLEELMLHLVVDYKHSLVEIELKETLNLLRQPEVMSDADKCLEVMSRCKELMEIKQQMAKHLGDRVIGG